MTIRITPAGIDDLDDVMQVMDRAFDPTFGEAWTRGQCAGFFGLGGTVLLVAGDGGGPTGFALSRSVLDDAELLLLAVTPSCRRRGIGRALVEASSGAMAHAGAHRFHLEMREGNPAQALYRIAGFVEVGRRRGYYRLADGGRADALTLCRTITPAG